MGKKLAIKGHSTRGKEVIELLEMLGGINDREYIGTNTWKDEYYTLDNGYIRMYDWSDDIKFTLEEFLWKYPFKIGDKVILDNKLCTITWMCWECNNIYYYVQGVDVMFQRKVEVNQLKPYKETNMNENKFGTAKEPLKPKSNAVKLIDNKVVDDLDEVKTMNKKLAIKGHSTRGKEVIELLEIMGGKNVNLHKGNFPNEWKISYYIYADNTIQFGMDENLSKFKFVIFTLEEFLEKYPFKVGDKVFLYDNITEGCVTGMEWDEEKGTVRYCVYTSSECWCDVKELLKWNNVDLVERHYMDNMKDKAKAPDMKGEDYSGKRFGYKIPDGYEFDVVVDGKIFLKPIKPKYPTTYEECCDMLNANEFVGYELMTNFPKLINARNAYWRIAGEEMGLGKPWEPDWDEETNKFTISNKCNKIYLNNTAWYAEVLSFPTAEMRDAFYENFKKEIEQCKELL